VAASQQRLMFRLLSYGRQQLVDGTVKEVFEDTAVVGVRLCFEVAGKPTFELALRDRQSS
jgi:hypothetical protein